MSYRGMDPAVVTRVADGLAQQAGGLESVTQQVDSLLQQTSAIWPGRDAQDFHQWWVGQHRPRLVSAIEDLKAASTNVRGQVAAQVSISSAGGDQLNPSTEDAAAIVRDGLPDKDRGLSAVQLLLTSADVAGGMAGARLEFNSNALRDTSKFLQGQAARDLDRALTSDPRITGKDQWYRSLDDAKRLSATADELAKTADGMERSSKSMPLKAGGALAALGIGYDIAHGKEPVQAVASGAGGFLASVGAGAATGAVVGSFVPVPGVGTAVGAVVGAGVGVFTSGAVDSLFENGPDVGKAAAAGWDAVGDTGGAVGSAVKGLFD